MLPLSMWIWAHSATSLISTRSFSLPARPCLLRWFCPVQSLTVTQPSQHHFSELLLLTAKTEGQASLSWLTGYWTSPIIKFLLPSLCCCFSKAVSTWPCWWTGQKLLPRQDSGILYHSFAFLVATWRLREIKKPPLLLPSCLSEHFLNFKVMYHLLFTW